jgi:phosphoglycerol transferase MdoB-like AlkP superfamily enzyme
MLGFETLIGPEAFTGATRGGAYVADVEIANRVAALLDAAPGGIMVFAITMEGHGPWDQADPAASMALPPALAAIPEAAALSRFLFRLHAADAALPILTKALRRRPGRGVLALYGDHQPSLPKAFSAIGFDDERTDYVIWRSDAPGESARCDLPAHQLGAAVLAAAGLPA